METHLISYFAFSACSHFNACVWATEKYDKIVIQGCSCDIHNRINNTSNVWYVGGRGRGELLMIRRLVLGEADVTCATFSSHLAMSSVFRYLVSLSFSLTSSPSFYDPSISFFHDMETCSTSRIPASVVIGSRPLCRKVLLCPSATHWPLL